MNFGNAIIKLFGVGFLTACVSSSSGSLSRAVSVITNENNIRISSPSGFCVDQRTTKKSQDSIGSSFRYQDSDIKVQLVRLAVSARFSV